MVSPVPHLLPWRSILALFRGCRGLRCARAVPTRGALGAPVDRHDRSVPPFGSVRCVSIGHVEGGPREEVQRDIEWVNGQLSGAYVVPKDFGPEIRFDSRKR